MEKLKNLINSAVGTEGDLDIPAYWMNKILSDLQKLIKATNNKIDEHSTSLADFESRVNSLESHSLFRLVPVLPATPKEDVIYLVPSQNEVEGNTLAEWAYLDGAWEQFGEFKPDIDLSEYLKIDDSPIEKGEAGGIGSHVEGVGTQTKNNGEHAEGRFNKSNSVAPNEGSNPKNTLHSVGIGASDTARKNAHEIMQDGKHYILNVGGYDGTNALEANSEGVVAKDVATVINELVAAINQLTGTVEE